MRFEASQHMRLGQQMKLAPRMIQSMEILQLPLAELEERIEQELESNVTLEVAEDDADAQDVRRTQAESERDARQDERPLTVDEDGGKADFERLDSFEESNPEAFEDEGSRADRPAPPPPDAASPARAPRADGERDAKMDAMAAAPARGASLADQLREQWRLADVDAVLRPLGELIISFIEEDGYLRTPLEAIADRVPATMPRPGVADLERALKAVQLFLDPPGVGARDLRECLLLQLDAMEDAAGGPGGAQHDADAVIPESARRLVRLLVEHHLDDIRQNRLPRIAERTGLSIDEIKQGVEHLRRLSPAPARRLVEDPPQPVIPDAIVEFDEEHDRYVAFLNDQRLPNLRINRQYAEMVRDRSVPKKDRDFIRTNVTNAQWLIDAIGQRRATLQRVLNVVVEAQRDFFDFGPQALKPLPMTQVAEQLGIHVATVSRAVADKHIQTPRGIVPLRRFFTGGMQTDSGEEVSYDAVKAALKEVVDAEDKSKPLSDDALAEALKKRGVEIARRTVAKYRDQLGIPSARLRRTF